MSEASPGFRSGSLTAALTSRNVLGAGIVELVFAMRAPARLEFQAGQFVSIGVGKDAAGTPLRRSYSIASPHRDGEHLRFIVRAIPDGKASEFLLGLPIGGEIHMTGPHGFFVLDPRHPGDVVLGATGTGVAAVLPMLSDLASRAVEGRRLLYWGARHEADLFARPEIEALCRAATTELAVYLTAPPPEWTGGRGRITAAILEALPTLKAPTFYLVGNGAMIADLKRELVARGVDRKRFIRTEAFFD